MAYVDCTPTEHEDFVKWASATLAREMRGLFRDVARMVEPPAETFVDLPGWEYPQEFVARAVLVDREDGEGWTRQRCAIRSDWWGRYRASLSGIHG